MDREVKYGMCDNCPYLYLDNALVIFEDRGISLSTMRTEICPRIDYGITDNIKPINRYKCKGSYLNGL